MRAGRPTFSVARRDIINGGAAAASAPFPSGKEQHHQAFLADGAEPPKVLYHAGVSRSSNKRGQIQATEAQRA